MSSRKIQDTYRATKLADARAAVIQAIEEQTEADYSDATIHSHREGGTFTITVTYEVADE